MLDNQDEISKIDKSNMLDSVAEFPEQIKKSYDIINSSKIEHIYKVDNIIFAGMGGSAISGDILQSFFRDKLDIPIYVNREYELPKWAHKNTLVITQSYSGNTEETLHSFKHAYQKRCKIVGISSDGKLEEFCEKRDVPFIKIPSGYPPRAATGYMLFSALLLLNEIGILKIEIDKEIEDTISVSEEFRSKNKKDVPTEENLSKKIAKQIHGKIPQVYGWKQYMPIAKRWCTQFNENSKIISRYDEVSECNHNDIVGWAMDPEMAKKFVSILFRENEDESIYLSTRLDFMKKLYETNAADTIEIDIKGKKKLSKMMYAMYLGDFISCYLAILRKIDPTPVSIISELKEELAKI